MAMTKEQALERLRGNDLLQLGMDAGDIRQELWPEPVVTYTVGYRLTVGGGVSPEEIAAAVGRGATGLVLSAAADARLDAVVADVVGIHAQFQELALTGFSAPEIAGLGDAADAFHALKSAGLCLFGNGSLQAAAGAKGDWAGVHRAAHASGIPSIAVLPLGSGDSAEDWVSQLEMVSALQHETAGFLACEARIEHMERALDEVTGAQYLKMVALCRLYLTNVPHVQADWSIFGPKVLQVALRFGVDDAGLVLATARDRLVPSHHSGEEELRRIIRDAGFTPVQRDAVYGRQFVS